MTLHLRDLENIEKGFKRGAEQERIKIVLNVYSKTHSVDQVAALFEIAPEEVRKIVEENLKQETPM